MQQAVDGQRLGLIHQVAVAVRECERLPVCALGLRALAEAQQGDRDPA